MSVSTASRKNDRSFGRPWSRAILAITLVAVSALNARAEMFEIVSSQDTWTVGETTNTSNHDKDGLRVHEANSGSSLFISWLQFDLSKLPANAKIDSAYVKLYLVSASSSNTNDIYIAASTHSNAAGTVLFDEAQFSHSTYAAGGSYNTSLGINEANWETDHAGLGDFGLPGGGILGDSDALPELNQYYNSANADAEELALLQSIYDNGGSLVIQLYAPNITGTHTRVFEDYEGSLTNATDGANGPRLVIEYSIVPEPSSLLLLAIGMIGSGLVMLRSRSLSKS